MTLSRKLESIPRVGGYDGSFFWYLRLTFTPSFIFIYFLKTFSSPKHRHVHGQPWCTFWRMYSFFELVPFFGMMLWLCWLSAACHSLHSLQTKPFLHTWNLRSTSTKVFLTSPLPLVKRKLSMDRNMLKMMRNSERAPWTIADVCYFLNPRMHCYRRFWYFFLSFGHFHNSW